MKALNLVSLILVIIGGINWGLVGLFQFDLVQSLFGAGSGLSRAIFVIVGLAALWQLVPFFRALSSGEVTAERGL